MDSVTYKIFKELISFDTVSHNSNLPLIYYLHEQLEGAGADCYILPSACGKKANFLARLGPDDRPGVMFSGHSDVVPVTDQLWNTDPFVLTKEENKFFGRGTADMKGFIAVVTSRFLVVDPKSLKVPLYLAVTHDEEIGCLGVAGLIDHMKEMVEIPYLCIVGEPTSMKLGIGHKGANSYSINIHSRPAHSSMAPLEVNSIELASGLIHKLTKLGREFEAEGPFDNDYRVPFATVHTGLIHGGVQVNIVPDFCNFQFEFRTLASQNPNEIESKILDWVHESELEAKQKVAESKVEVTKNYGYPGLETDQQSEGYQLALQAFSHVDQPVKLAFGTEAGSYQNFLGVCSIVCGPGDIAQAHKSDEFVTDDQMIECEKFVDKVIALSQDIHDGG